MASIRGTGNSRCISQTISTLAGAPGFEPRNAVLETAVLPVATMPLKQKTHRFTVGLGTLLEVQLDTDCDLTRDQTHDEPAIIPLARIALMLSGDCRIGFGHRHCFISLVLLTTFFYIIHSSPGICLIIFENIFRGRPLLWTRVPDSR